MVLNSQIVRARRIGIRVVGIYLLLAGVGKMLEPVSVYRVFAFDGLTDPHFQYLAAMALIVIESLLGIFALFYPNNRRVLGALIGLFSCFVVQLAFLHLAGGPKLCGCLGWVSWLLPEFNLIIGLLINIAIVALSLWCLLAVPATNVPADPLDENHGRFAHPKAGESPLAW